MEKKQNQTLFPGRIVKVKSFTDPKKEYEVDIDHRLCSCKAFENQGGECKHIKWLLGKYKEITKNGYRTDEVISALQKEIRRGHKEEAAYWCLELLESEMDWRLWRRLRIIAVEDIDNPNAIIYVGQLERGFYLTGKGLDGWLFAVRAVVNLAEEMKNRTSDDLLAWWMDQKKKGKKLEMPDYAIDQHTARGKKRGRGNKHFWQEGAKLDRPSKNYDTKYLEYFKEKER